MRNVPEKKAAENNKTYFVLYNFFTKLVPCMW